MDSYIEFKKYNDYLMCIIHKDGHTKRVTNPTNVNKLIKLAKEVGYKDIKGPCTISKKTNLIIRRYNIYYRSKKQDTLSIVLDNIHGHMIINKNKSKSHAARNIIIGTIIATTITIPTVNGLMDKHMDNTPNITHETEYILDDEKIDDMFETEFQKQDEINSMLEEQSFHYNYEDRTNNESFHNASRYDDLFEKYGNYYGVDKNLLKAIAAQESGGDHNSALEGYPAVGLMQLEKAAILGETISAYNYVTETTDEITVDMEDLLDLETNVRLSAMVFQNCLNYENGNPILALQTYNFGVGNIYNMLEIYSNDSNKSIDEIRNNKNDNKWLDYREYITQGDSKYVEHVLSYLEKDQIQVKYKGKTITQNITNDYMKENIKS